MEAIEEWVKDQKEMINEVEKIWRGYNMQRMEEREWRKEQRKWREEERQWRQEEREQRERMENRKDEGVQTNGEDKEVGLGLDEEVDGEGEKE